MMGHGPIKVIHDGARAYQGHTRWGTGLSRSHMMGHGPIKVTRDEVRAYQGHT